MRPLDDAGADLADRGMRQNLARFCRSDPRRLQRLPRQVEAAERRILVEVAQNIGELERAAQVVGKRDAGIGLHAKNAH